ncbi:MAG: GNAT family N-acetyltransferase [Clostridia bacterium]|nr:GNAT family N-acetyltransferase [Clostridia bacterium]
MALGAGNTLREFMAEPKENGGRKSVEIKRFTKELLNDVIAFEMLLREEEDFWGWEINDAYIAAVRDSFDDSSFGSAVSFLAYKDGKAVGRIDATVISSHFDGSRKAYLDWICVAKRYRHKGIAQELMKSLREYFRSQGIRIMVGLIDGNPEAQRFYRSIDNAMIRDEGIWIDL